MPIGMGAGLALSGVASLAGGLLGGSKTSTTTSTPTYSADQQGIQHDVASTLQTRLQNPGAVFDPLKSAALESNNRNYDNLTARLKASASGRGFGRAGSTIGNQQGIEVARAGSMGDIDSKFAGMQVDYENNLLDQAQRFGFTNPGNTGTSTTPNNAGGSALSGGLSTLTTLLTLNKLLKGGGGAAMGPPQTDSIDE